MNTSTLLPAARVAALFASPLSAGREPTPAEVDRAIQESVRAHGGIRGCCAEMAAAYGDYPETAVTRTRWARRAVATTYPPRPLRRRPAGRRPGRCTTAQGYPRAA
jgi:hypothetical protein